MHLTLDVPDDDALGHWANEAFKRQPADLVVRDAAGGQAIETLHLPNAYCIGYFEDFVAGDEGAGAYVCHVTLSDPDGWTLVIGGPGGPFQAPAPGEHGLPGPTEVWRENDAPLPIALPAGLSDGPGTTLSPGLAAMLGQSLLIERAGGEDGPDMFEEAVKAHLQQIYNTPTGRGLLDSLHKSGKATTIQYALDGFNYAVMPNDKALKDRCFYQADGITPGAGLGILIGYHPGNAEIGKDAWSKRPPAIGLAHELIHAEQAAYGRMRQGMGLNPSKFDKRDPTKPAMVPIMELEAVGIPPHDKYHVTENKIRSEWAQPQIARTAY